MTAAPNSLSLRERAARHPMAVFAFAAGIALVSIGTVGSGVPHRPEAPAAGEGAPKSDRLRPPTQAEIACAGQAWGSEDAKCLLAILREGGKSDFARIRTISGA